MKYSLIIITIFTLLSCGNKENNSLADKKNKLEKLKTEQASIAKKIKNIETEILKLDTSLALNETAKLVGVLELATSDFKHYIELQGKIDADDISYISPRLGPAQVQAVYVKKGALVKRGQLLLKLDDAVIKQSIAAAKQGLESLKSQVLLAKDVYNRQNSLWKQGIGTEVQLISSKTNSEVLEKQLKAGEENIKTMQEQASATNVYSNVNGIADEVNISVGEMFTGFIGNMPQIKIVNTSSLKVIVDVPENYAAKVKVGSKIVVSLSDINKTYQSSISLVGKTINPNNRSFLAEAKLPYDGLARPNQNAAVKIEDYAAKNVLTIPVNTIQTDENGKYVYVAMLEGSKLIARKKSIIVGELNGEIIEIKSGLEIGFKLISEGYQNLYEGQSLKIN